ncbi:RDD family protein [Natronococcus sp. A-GB1]|uniref:RDD family protein n=1 Tax=Natronococcus sp. A-GB1 TaxID=3037648 RepID=UPI00241FAA95|nr:RDD family protein [Natronococcus sp. A-GB1]MDG5762068.1 RDD family protein [Natronococcus sp. A-GB1]
MNIPKYPTPRMDTESGTTIRRFAAFLLDGIIFGLATLVLLVPASFLGDAVTVVVGLIISVVAFVYVFFLEGMYGYTPGKYALGLVVVKSDGSNCTIGASVLRNLLLIVDSLPFAYLIGIVLILLTDKDQRVGDLAADTVVVRRQ